MSLMLLSVTCHSADRVKREPAAGPRRKVSRSGVRAASICGATSRGASHGASHGGISAVAVGGSTAGVDGVAICREGVPKSCSVAGCAIVVIPPGGGRMREGAAWFAGKVSSLSATGGGAVSMLYDPYHVSAGTAWSFSLCTTRSEPVGRCRMPYVGCLALTTVHLACHLGAKAGCIPGLMSRTEVPTGIGSASGRSLDRF